MQIASAIVAGLVLAAVTVARYLSKENAEVEVALGAAAGTLTFGLLFGWAVRFAWVRWRKQGAVRSHWLLWLAVPGAAVSMAGNLQRDRQTDLERARDSVASFQERERQRCGRVAAFEFPQAEGLTARPATPDETGPIGGVAGSAGLQALAIEDPSGLIAFVSVAVVSPEAAPSFMSATSDAVVEDGGRRLETVRIAQTNVDVFATADDQRVMAFHGGCHAIVVRAADVRTGRRIVRAIARAAP